MSEGGTGTVRAKESTTPQPPPPVPPPTRVKRPADTRGDRRSRPNSRIDIWRTEVNGSILYCACSGTLADRRQKLRICPHCHATLDVYVAEVQQQPRLLAKPKSLKKVVSTLFKRKGDAGDKFPPHLYTAIPEDEPHSTSSTGARAGKATSSQQATRPALVHNRSTEMYRELRDPEDAARGGADGQDDDNDAASVSTLLSGFSSESNDGGERVTGKLKLTLDDTAARLRRAQRLLDAQARREGR